MPSLQVRELPDQIYYKLQQEAEAEHRSLSQQAIMTLAKGLNVSVKPTIRRKQLLESLEELSENLKQYDLSDPVKSLRQDRER